MLSIKPAASPFRGGRVCVAECVLVRVVGRPMRADRGDALAACSELRTPHATGKVLTAACLVALD